MPNNSVLLEHSSINEMMIEERKKAARRKATKVGLVAAIALATIAGVLYAMFR